MFNIIKKIWNAILDAIAWLTKDSARIQKSKRLKPDDEILMGRRFPTHF